jgi:hypothetical protein
VTNRQTIPVAPAALQTPGQDGPAPQRAGLQGLSGLVMLLIVAMTISGVAGFTPASLPAHLAGDATNAGSESRLPPPVTRSADRRTRHAPHRPPFGGVVALVNAPAATSAALAPFAAAGGLPPIGALPAVHGHIRDSLIALPPPGTLGALRA